MVAMVGIWLVALYIVGPIPPGYVIAFLVTALISCAIKLYRRWKFFKDLSKPSQKTAEPRTESGEDEIQYDPYGGRWLVPADRSLPPIRTRRIYQCCR